MIWELAVAVIVDDVEVAVAVAVAVCDGAISGKESVTTAHWEFIASAMFPKLPQQWHKSQYKDG